MKWQVCIPVHASTIVEVEADSAEEAIEKAYEVAPLPSVCHYCSHSIHVDAINDDDGVADAWIAE